MGVVGVRHAVVVIIRVRIVPDAIAVRIHGLITVERKGIVYVGYAIAIRVDRCGGIRRPGPSATAAANKHRSQQEDQ